MRKLVDRPGGESYPGTHEYRMSWWDRGMGILLMLGGWFVLFQWSAGNYDTGNPRQDPFLAGALVTVGGLVFTYWTFNTKVRLSPDAIELQKPLSSKSLPLQAIKGRREYEPERSRYSPKRYFLVVANSDELPTLRLRSDLNFDDAFFAWFHSLPDLDALDKEHAESSDVGLV